MSDNKLVKTLTDAATVTGLAAGIGFLAKKVINEPMTSDPSSNLMNYVKFTVVIAAYEEYEENRAKLNDWIMTNDRIKDEAKENFKHGLCVKVVQ